MDGAGESASIAEIMTAEQLQRVQLPGKSTELVRGRLVAREPPGTHHGKIAGRLLTRVGAFVEAHDLGEVFGQDTGFKIASNPDTVRAPDLAFVARERLSHIAQRGYASVAPHLVAEILSPEDRPGEVIAKIGEWLSAGVTLAWVLDPERRIAYVHRADGTLSVIGVDGALDGEGVLPGFNYALRTLYRE
jgi:Uma2 family endonuclease